MARINWDLTPELYRNLTALSQGAVSLTRTAHGQAQERRHPRLSGVLQLRRSDDRPCQRPPGWEYFAVVADRGAPACLVSQTLGLVSAELDISRNVV